MKKILIIAVILLSITRLPLLEKQTKLKNSAVSELNTIIARKDLGTAD